jgi:hypothetical protein
MSARARQRVLQQAMGGLVGLTVAGFSAGAEGPMSPPPPPGPFNEAIATRPAPNPERTNPADGASRDPSAPARPAPPEAQPPAGESSATERPR